MNEDLEPSKRKRPAARAARRAKAERAAVSDASRAQRSGAGTDAGAGADENELAAADKAARRVAARAPGAGKRKAARSGTASKHVAVAPPDRPGAAPPPPSSVAADAEANASVPGTTGEAAERDVERELTGLLRDIDGLEDDAQARQRAAEAIGRIAARLYPESQAAAGDEEGLFPGARQLLSTDYYLRQWSRLGLRGRSEQVDDFGLDPTYEARVQPVLDLLYERYFRVQVHGAEHVPAHGAALLVCNHSGTLPWDGVMLKTALRHMRSDRGGLRWLTDDFVFHSPFLGAWLNRIGAVRACQENAERLLGRGELLAVFPEGVKGIGKPYRERYQLQRFGRGGHVKLALRMGVPLIPVAIVGAEETYPLLHKVRAFSKLVGMPFLPITPLFPWLGPLGLMPLPSRWQIVFGEPMHEIEELGDRAGDSVLVNELNEQLRGRVQSLLHDALQTRGPNAFL